MKDNKKTKQNPFTALIGRCIAFILIFCVIFAVDQRILQPKWGEKTAGAHETLNSKAFYEEPEDSLDVIIYGSSFAFFGTSPMTIWNEYGITSFVRGSANQFPYFTYYMMKDSFKSQHPKVAVLEVGRFFVEFNKEADEWTARRALDYMRFGKTKLEAVRNLDLEGTGESRLSYILPFFRYHDRWKELTGEDFQYFSFDSQGYMKGQYAVNTGILDFHWPEGYMEYSDVASELPADNELYLRKIIEICREEGIELMFYKSPMDGWSYGLHNGIQLIADEYGIPFVDYCLPEYCDAAGIIDTEDFTYNQYHLRYTGAEKLSRHLAAYLKEHYGLSDHRGDPQYVSWNEDFEKFHDYKMSHNLFKLDDPVLVSVTSTPQGVIFVWKPVVNAASYYVYRRTPDTRDWVRIGEVDASATSFLDATVESGKTYIYTVKAARNGAFSFCDIYGLSIRYDGKLNQTVQNKGTIPEYEVPEPDFYIVM